MLNKSFLNSAPAHSAWWDALRVYLGIALFVKGLVFLKDSSLVLALLSQAHVPFASSSLAEFVAVTHLAGGMLLAFGMLTRFAAAIQIPNLVGAVLLVHLKDGLFTQGQTLEFSVLVLFVLCLFTFAGAGKYSVDYHFADAAPLPPEGLPEATVSSF